MNMYLFNFTHINSNKEMKIHGPAAYSNHFQNLITYKLYSTLKHTKFFLIFIYLFIFITVMKKVTRNQITTILTTKI